ncbi:MAG: tetratricopeptide repeat protein [Brevundimonas sp.]|uniref:tetratricopeptide repeat protein n=1 Tax=Alphaproteobacteria TaxID=28211 RepID=UPI002720549C|nr:MULTISPECIES: tetratricopeptide repeat protein [Alphaproteobacteria]MDO9641320.1 tetratricopeptide repeat protein [Pseudotabrizicola sp.]MDP2763959.1 tetratricopeptide repeat protein [Brevundimonas sp.]MDP3369194.1 tetratricopeptide repeat protein [Brevundimonas sp.]MDP3656391.1 tetratricopeptide repeat protein [Brevundimonas sp.]MDZ4110879.1 tetratricopeptide repeat protein [Brevundimonas sp.]
MIGRATFAVAACLALGHAGSATAQETEVNADVRAAARQVAAGERDAGLRRLETLAEAGDIDAHNMLGEMYIGLGGVERDRLKSCQHFRAAREARPSASHNYGQCLWEGAFGERDFAEARIWYRRGADGGFLQAKCALGNMLIRGEGGPTDPEAGVALCREAAEAGEPNAQTDMGDHYRRGGGVPQDYAEARRWYRLAAAQDQRNAAYNLGTLDWNGQGGPIDLAAAGQWMEKAYQAGRRDAAALAGQAAFLRAVPNAPSGPVDMELLALAKRWFLIAMNEDPSGEGRAHAAVSLAQISGYEALARQQAADE